MIIVKLSLSDAKCFLVFFMIKSLGCVYILATVTREQVVLVTVT